MVHLSLLSIVIFYSLFFYFVVSLQKEGHGARQTQVA